ncbi:TPA: hypothetical protein I7793_17465 [Vibrio vulnificus]|nr:hypothetical protein [Vibrio vulnificus]
MFKINYVSSDIRVIGSDKKYGFKCEFGNGLNIIKGQNSTGKSSILSCIYYNLGMEQLLGMSTSRTSLLDKCLTSEFIYKEETFSVTQSIIRLEIENSNGDIALIERTAVSPVEDAKNTIVVYQNENVNKYYLHSPNDHTHKYGFYTWLQDYIGIELPKDPESNKNTLYLQNIFSGCFIEQTKGWSDFMSQMPSFNIKDARRKLVEYFLSLECLENDIEKDKLTNKKNSLIENWNQAVRDFDKLDHSLSYTVNGLGKKFEKSKIDSLKNLQLKIRIDSEWIDINTAHRIKLKELEKLRKQNRGIEKRKDLSEISNRRKALKANLLKLNRIKSSLDRSYTTEKFKVKSYSNHLKRLTEERSNIVGSRKVDQLISELSSSENCPLCDSLISVISPSKEVSKSDYESSLKFIDSKISMITSYLESFSNYEEDYVKDCNYYNTRIYATRTEIANLDRDLNSNVDKSLHRSLIQAEIVTSNLLDRLAFLIEEFDKFKEQVNNLNTLIVNIDIRIKNINQSFSSDEDKISSFESTFRSYLSKFHYESNQVYKVNINKKQPFKVFPSVFNASAGSAQPIRLASSASDFIRSEWAFYLALLIKSKVHPGVLIFDEPGQHAMSIDSMTKLLEESEKIKDRQLIFAISKVYKGYGKDKEDFIIENITANLQDFKEIEIDSDNHKLVAEMQ